MEGATVAARYLPGTAAIDVGGDWFDTIPLADGRLGFVVGDVVGKGVQAAATMAQLRNGMRALTLDSSDPATVVTKLNRLLDSVTDSPFATLAFVVVDPNTHEAEMISAGHLPPLVVSPRAASRGFLEGVRGLPLGVEPEATYEAWTTTLEPGSAIVLYTDGLVERRDRSLDDGLGLLADAVRGVTTAPDELVDTIIERLIGDRRSRRRHRRPGGDARPCAARHLLRPAAVRTRLARRASTVVRRAGSTAAGSRRPTARSDARDVGGERERDRARRRARPSP